MKLTLYTMALMAALSTVSFAADFSGDLIDAACNDQKQQGDVISCDATTSTKEFGIRVHGKIYRLDAAGNAKATEALNHPADHPADASKAASDRYTATVSGTEKRGKIAVDSIEIQ